MTSSRRIAGLPITAILALLICQILSVNCKAQDRIEFNRDIRPILSRNCISCHGPDEAHREADFRIDIRDDALMGIEPGDAESSEVFLRITSEDDDRMPPVEHGEPLTAAETELIRKWIDGGADYQVHWAFVPPTKNEPPKADQALFQQWPRTEIDSFILRSMVRQGLEPSPPSDPARLIRRLALDLTGLPPSQSQVASFVDSPTAETYERIVDELLASPAFGEHWASMWLDIARYADTVGYAEDKHRNIWPWRDWVIRAFNNNMPFDQFTREQLAGDLLPNPTEQQRLATAFHRNTLNNTEGGTSDEEFRVIAVKDRINTTVNTWMGLTFRCAECHTHKYDPITQTEYYQFFDFFNQTSDADKNDDRPHLELFPEGREKKIAALDREIEKLRQTISKQPPLWKTLTPSETSSKGGAILTVQSDHSVLATGTNPQADTYKIQLRLPAGIHTGIRIETLPDSANGGFVGRHPGGSFAITAVSAAISDGADRQRVSFSMVAADHVQPGHSVETIITEHPNDIGWAVGHRQDGYKQPRYAIFQFAEPLNGESETTLTVTVDHQSKWPGTNSGRLRFSSTAVENPVERFKSGKLEPEKKKLANLLKEKSRPVKVPVMDELADAKHRSTFVMLRGSHLQPGEAVNAAVPKAFHSFGPDAPRNRLGVADWILSENNPLTARVAVNRFWARVFGLGIVETEEDFGTQGSTPTHPELLDWLAIDFRSHGWDVKRLLRQMVLSATYQQSNATPAAKQQSDPRNLYLSRGPRNRLRAEVVRDQALAVSGLLTNRQFGPPVYPPNPVKRVVSAFTGGMNWNESKDEDRYRRAIYTYLKRTAPHPLFDTFDMATREVCNLRRIDTNTPLQAFMTLNDTTFMEAAQSLAAKMLESHPSNRRKQIRFGLKKALFREPSASQITTLEDLFEQTLLALHHQPEAIEELSSHNSGQEFGKIDQAHLAAMTVVANVILNLDEFLTR